MDFFKDGAAYTVWRRLLTLIALGTASQDQLRHIRFISHRSRCLLSLQRMLVEKSADVNAHGGEYGNVFWVACSLGYKEVIQMLVENEISHA